MPQRHNLHWIQKKKKAECSKLVTIQWKAPWLLTVPFGYVYKTLTAIILLQSCHWMDCQSFSRYLDISDCIWLHYGHVLLGVNSVRTVLGISGKLYDPAVQEVWCSRTVKCEGSHCFCRQHTSIKKYHWAFRDTVEVFNAHYCAGSQSQECIITVAYAMPDKQPLLPASRCVVLCNVRQTHAGGEAQA